jgi:alkylglycerol monooxygenase
MEEIAKIFSIAMPVFLVLVLAEKTIGYLVKHDTVPWMDALSSAYSGIGFTIRALFGVGISIVSYDFMYQHLAIIHIETTWLVYVITFIFLDFQFYWGHRLSHQINLLWNNHLIHHNSEEYNLATSIRQPFLAIINFLFFLSIPAAILGLSPAVIALILPFHKFAQVWYHTQLIGKLGFLEHIIVTPSQHRVHHALNPIYLDKNFSAIFNIWDKLFGTFQEELESEPPVYGITRPSNSYNPIKVNLEHLTLLIKDAWRAEKWLDKLTIWVRPTGWRPDGFEEKYPVEKITNHFNYKKFQPEASFHIKIWSTIQFLVLFIFVIYVLGNFVEIGVNRLLLFVFFVFAQIFSATELMNRNNKANLYSLICTLICLGIHFSDFSFFDVSRISAYLPLLFLGYFCMQTIFAFAFTNNEYRRNLAGILKPN